MAVEVEFTVKLKLDEMPPKSYLKEYVREAIDAWGGQRHPEDWMFDNVQKVTVGKIDRQKT